MTANAQAANLAELMSNLELGEEATTAFLIYQTPEGQWVATADYENKTLNLARQATLDDIVGGCAAVQSGCIVQQAAMSTLIAMEQRAAAMQRMMQDQAATQDIASKLDLSKMRNPRA